MFPYDYFIRFRWLVDYEGCLILALIAGEDVSPLQCRLKCLLVAPSLPKAEAVSCRVDDDT